MTLSGKAEGRAQNRAAKHFELSHGELAISDAIGQPDDSDPIKLCYKRDCCNSVTKSWETFLLISSLIFSTILHTHTKRAFKFFPLSFCWISLTQSSYESKKLSNCSLRTAIKGAGMRGHNHQDKNIKSLLTDPLGQVEQLHKAEGTPIPTAQCPGLPFVKWGVTKFIFSVSLGAIWGTQFHLNWVKQTELKSFNLLKQVNFENKQFCSKR